MDKNSNVVSIESPAQLVELVKRTDKEKRLLVVDYYTVWCKPCKIAAPIVAKMSSSWPSVLWCKVDCDKQRELVSSCVCCVSL